MIYAAETPETAILESLIRDRFEGPEPRTVNRAEIEDRSVVRFRADDLVQLDVTGVAPARIGVPTDAVRARPHAEGRASGEAVRTHLPAVNAILWPSRSTLADNGALFGGRGASLSLERAAPLIDEAALADVLESFASTPIDEG